MKLQGIPKRIPKAKQNPRYKTYGPHKGWLWHNTERRCHWCKADFQEFVDATVDHTIPLSRGGTNDLGNLVLACHSCNSLRGDTMPEVTGKIQCKNSRRHTEQKVSGAHPQFVGHFNKVIRKCRSCRAVWHDPKIANDCCDYGRGGPRKVKMVDFDNQEATP